MKTRLFLLALLLIPFAAVHAQDNDTDVLRITGSNVFGEKLGPQILEAFAKLEPNIRVKLKRPGTSQGFAALIAGEADIAPASRPANRKELAAAKAAGRQLRSYTIGSYGVSIIINEANPLRSLKPSQIRDIFTGKITDWKQVGAPAGAIQPFVLDKHTGARVGFQLLAMKGANYVSTAQSLPDYAAIGAAVASDPLAIGYNGIGAAPSGTRALLVNGQSANAAAIYEGLYPYANRVYLYTTSGKENTNAQKFIRFILSRQGQGIIENASYAPAPRPSLGEGAIPGF